MRLIIPINPSSPNFIKKFNFTPDMNNRTIIVITIIIPVPKSGWSIISPNIKITMLRMGRTDVLISFILFVVRYFAVKIIMPSFANSLGWIPRDPIPNQLLDPFLIVPIPGINTSIRRRIHISKILLLYFRYV